MSTQPDQILIVDDEENIRLTLQTLLTRSGYSVTMAASGEEAVSLVKNQTFDLLLVDLKMPGVDGMQVVAVAREYAPDTAIIILTGHGSLETAIESLRHGVFDYLLKTTDPSQVVERVKAGLADRGQKLRQRALLDAVSNAVQELRTGQGTVASQATEAPVPTSSASSPPEVPAERAIHVGDLQIDTWRQAATFAGRQLLLTPTEFRVLLCLAEQVGKMLTYTQIVRCAQGYEASEPEASELIKPHIYHLRQKLEPDPSTPRYLLNVRGKGYMLQV